MQGPLDDTQTEQIVLQRNLLGPVELAQYKARSSADPNTTLLSLLVTDGIIRQDLIIELGIEAPTPPASRGAAGSSLRIRRPMGGAGSPGMGAAVPPMQPPPSPGGGAPAVPAQATPGGYQPPAPAASSPAPMLSGFGASKSATGNLGRPTAAKSNLAPRTVQPLLSSAAQPGQIQGTPPAIQPPPQTPPLVAPVNQQAAAPAPMAPNPPPMPQQPQQPQAPAAAASPPQPQTPAGAPPSLRRLRRSFSPDQAAGAPAGAPPQTGTAPAMPPAQAPGAPGAPGSRPPLRIPKMKIPRPPGMRPPPIQNPPPMQAQQPVPAQQPPPQAQAQAQPAPQAAPPVQPTPQAAPPAQPTPQAAPPAQPTPQAAPPAQPTPQAAPPAQPAQGISAEIDENEVPEGWPGGIAPEDPSPNSIQLYFKAARAAGASDVHMSVGLAPMMRLHGSLRPIQDGHPPLQPADTERLIRQALTPQQWDYFDKFGDLDLSYAFGTGGRFRTNILKQRNGMDLAARVIGAEIKSLEELGINPKAKRLTDFAQGLVLVTGPSGHGKTTTMFALAEMVNTNRQDHLITVEEPIEYVLTGKSCQVTQREVGPHTKSFATALKAALREDPDIIVIGELRDYDTTSMAINAAETGHLVFSSLPTQDCAKTLDKLIDVFPPEEQSQIRLMVSESLRGIISQQLIPRKDGQGRVAAIELLFNSIGVANIIREANTAGLINAMQLGKKLGMVLMDDSLTELLDKDLIDGSEAYLRANAKQKFIKYKPKD